LELPAPSPAAKFEFAVVANGLLYSAGAGSRTKGTLGEELTVAQGYAAAQEAGLQLLANIETSIGSLDRILRLVKVTCMVNSAPGFSDQPQVANGFTELMLTCFGEKAGRHARTAVGVASLPGGIAVEVELVAEVSE
jgi:enamine deaminase RidA (YjgF/YER057c/UK114 family)